MKRIKQINEIDWWAQQPSNWMALIYEWNGAPREPRQATFIKSNQSFSRCARRLMEEMKCWPALLPSFFNSAQSNWLASLISGGERKEINQMEPQHSFKRMPLHWLTFLSLIGLFFAERQLMINERKVKPFHSILLNEWNWWNWFHFFSFTAAHSNQQFKSLLIVDGRARQANQMKRKKKIYLFVCWVWLGSGLRAAPFIEFHSIAA